MTEKRRLHARPCQHLCMDAALHCPGSQAAPGSFVDSTGCAAFSASPARRALRLLGTVACTMQHIVLLTSDSPACLHTDTSPLQGQGRERKTWLHSHNVLLLPFCAAVQKRDRFCKSSVEGILKDQIMVMLLCFLGRAGSALCFLSNSILAS